jgi:hypothetical protein
VSANRGPATRALLEIEVKGLPKWITTQTAIIPPGQDSTTVVLQAAIDAPLNAEPAPFRSSEQPVGARKLVRRRIGRAASARERNAGRTILARN